MNDDLRNRLREAYDLKALDRENLSLQQWKIEERGNFLATLQQKAKRSLLEIGAGSGKDAKYFQDRGMQVVCTDLSTEMARLSKQKRLRVCLMDFTRLAFSPRSFDVVYALNCLLHVPKAELVDVLLGIRAILRPDGLFYMGVYGGYDFEGVWEDDGYEPRRFFAFYTDEHLQAVLERVFQIHSFKSILLDRDDSELHFQSFILHKM